MNQTIDTIRASEAPIVLECGKAAEPPEHEIDTSGPDAALGQAAHASLEAWARDNFLGEPDAQPYADCHGVDPDKVATLVHAAPALLERCGLKTNGAQAEVDVKGGYVRGRVDLMTAEAAPDLEQIERIVIVDWKTGQDPHAGSKPAQRLAYASAVAAVNDMPASGVIDTYEVWLAADTVIRDAYTWHDIAAFRSRLKGRLERPTARPGPYCRYCRRIHECTERDAYLRSAATALAPVDAATLTPEAIAALWDESRALKQALDSYDKAVDALVDLTGELPLADGRCIVHTYQTRETIDARKAWAIIEAAGLGPDEINAVLSVSKTKLLNQVAKLAPRGTKATAKADVMTALDLAGAVKRTTSRRKRVRGPRKGEK